MMNPIAFEIFGIEVRWYGILMASGILIASMLLLKWSKEKGYKEDDIINLLLIVIPAAIICARLYYVIFEWEHYQGDFLKIINVREGGLAIHGGVIGGVLAGLIYCKIKKLNFLEIIDMVAPGLILAQAIGRWGNYANGEAHGGPTDLPWAINVAGTYVHPTFLYESIWNLCIFIFLFFYRKNKKIDGELFLLYGILYSAGRFWIEGLRTDSLMLGEFRVAQLISIGIIFAFSVVYIWKIRKKKK